MVNKLKLIPRDDLNEKNAEKYNVFKKELDEAIKSENMIAIIGDYSTGKSSYIKTYRKDKNLKNVYDVSFFNSEDKKNMDEKMYETYVLQCIYEQLKQQVNTSLLNRLDIQIFGVFTGIMLIVFNFQLLDKFFLQLKANSELKLHMLTSLPIGIEVNIPIPITIIIIFILTLVLSYIVIHFLVKIGNKYTVDKLKLKLKSTIMDVELSNEDINESNHKNFKSYQLFQKSILDLITQSGKKEVIFIFQDLDRVADEKLIRILKDLNEAMKNIKIKSSILVPIKRNIVGDIKTKVKYFDDIIYIKRDINESNNYDFFLEHIDKQIKNIVLYRDNKSIKFEEMIEIQYMFQFIPTDLRVLNNLINEVNSEKDYIIENRDKVDAIIYFICCRNIYYIDFNILSISKYLNDTQEKKKKLETNLELKRNVTDEDIFAKVTNQNVQNLGFERFKNEKNSFINNSNYRSGYQEFSRLKTEFTEELNELESAYKILFTTNDDYWKDFESKEFINYGLKENIISSENVRFIENVKTYENLSYKIMRQGYSDAKNKLEYLINNYNQKCTNEAYYIGGHIPNSNITKRMLEVQDETYFKKLSVEELKVLLICESIEVFYKILKYISVEKKIKIEDLINATGEHYIHDIQKYKLMYVGQHDIDIQILDYSRNISQYSHQRQAVIEELELKITVDNFKWVYQNDIINSNKEKYFPKLLLNENENYSFNTNLRYLELELDFELDHAIRLLCLISSEKIIGGKEQYLNLVFDLFDKVEVIKQIFLYQIKDEDENFEPALELIDGYLKNEVNEVELIEIYEKLVAEVEKDHFYQLLPTWYKKIVVDNRIEDLLEEEILNIEVDALVSYVRNVDELSIKLSEFSQEFRLEGFEKNCDVEDLPLPESYAKLSMFSDFENGKLYLNKLVEISENASTIGEIKEIINEHLIMIFDKEKDNIETNMVVKLVDHINQLETTPQEKSKNTKYKNKRLKH